MDRSSKRRRARSASSLSDLGSLLTARYERAREMLSSGTDPVEVARSLDYHVIVITRYTKCIVYNELYTFVLFIALHVRTRPRSIM